MRILVSLMCFIILSSFVAFRAFRYPMYEASAVIMVDFTVNPTALKAFQADSAEMLGQTRMAVELLRSDPLIRGVVEELDLRQDINAGFSLLPPRDDGGGAPEERDIRVMMERLRSGYLAVSAAPFTNLVTIKVSYPVREKAARIANSLTDRFVAWSGQFVSDEAKELAAYLDSRIDEASRRVKTAEEELKSFKERYKIADLPEETRLALDRRARLESEYFQASVREQESASTLESLKAKLKAYILNNNLDQFDPSAFPSAVTDNAAVKELEKEIFAMEMELGRLRELYADESPQVRNVKERIAKARSRMSDAMRDIFSSELSQAQMNPLMQQLTLLVINGEADTRAARAKAAALKQIIGQEESRLTAVPEEEMTLLRLARECRIAEDSYSFLIKEREKAKLVEVKENKRAVKIVSRAPEPYKPSGRLKILAAGEAASLFIAIVLPWMVSAAAARRRESVAESISSGTASPRRRHGEQEALR